MPKPLNTYKALQAFLLENECFKIHNNVLFCDVCYEKKIYVPKEGITPLKKHLNSASHKQKKLLKEKQSRLNLQVSTERSDHKFHKELLKMFVKCNFPISKADDVNFKVFFVEKYTGKKSTRPGFTEIILWTNYTKIKWRY
jgi:hypothetical protein